MTGLSMDVEDEPRQRIHIGTSGWHYRHWSGPFYPPELNARGFLPYYAERFDTVEINNTFYQLPSHETFVQWREAVPDGFLFAVKANRYITHMKKLKEPQKPVDRFLTAVRELQHKLGPILFQLPPNWRANVERLRAFLDALPTGYTYAFEFRDPSWFEGRVYGLLREYGAAFCIHDLAGQGSPEVITTDTIFVRMHGPTGPYQGSYTAEKLAYQARALSAWAAQGSQVYCYFNNDVQGYAPQNALQLREMIEA